MESDRSPAPLDQVVGRRTMLCKHAPTCQCGSRQVQLEFAQVKPAQWRCRDCKRRFTYEPPNRKDQTAGASEARQTQ